MIRLLGNIDPNNIDPNSMTAAQWAVVIILAFVAISVLQAVLKSTGKLLRWLLSTGLTVACVFLLWRGGGFEWLDGFLSSSGQ